MIRGCLCGQRRAYLGAEEPPSLEFLSGCEESNHSGLEEGNRCARSNAFEVLAWDRPFFRGLGVVVFVPEDLLERTGAGTCQAILRHGRLKLPRPVLFIKNFSSHRKLSIFSEWGTSLPQCISRHKNGIVFSSRSCSAVGPFSRVKNAELGNLLFDCVILRICGENL